MYFASFINNFAVISLLIILTLKGYPCIPKLAQRYFDKCKLCCVKIVIKNYKLRIVLQYISKKIQANEW